MRPQTMKRRSIRLMGCKYGTRGAYFVTIGTFQQMQDQERAAKIWDNQGGTYD